MNEFLSWRAHYVEDSGHCFVVFMNDASGFTVVVNDVKAAKLRKLPEMFKQNLLEIFYSLNVNPDVIRCYLEELGNKAIYAKNADRKKTAQLNQRIQDLLWILDDISNDIELSLDANNLIYNVLDKDGAIKPKKKMLELLGRYGLPVIKCAAIDLRVRLLLGVENRDAIRHLRVSINISFENLHRILQTAFGWQNSHLYSFGMLKEWDEDCYHKPEVKLFSKNEDIENDPNAIYTEDKKLIDYLGEYQKILYIYDYGDCWLHQIEIENLIPDCVEELPILLSGEGDAPPEDVGGPGSFAEFLAIINNPKHEDFESMKSWAESQGWKPFDYPKIAQMVKNVK